MSEKQRTEKSYLEQELLMRQAHSLTHDVDLFQALQGSKTHIDPQSVQAQTSFGLAQTALATDYRLQSGRNSEALAFENTSMGASQPDQDLFSSRHSGLKPRARDTVLSGVHFQQVQSPHPKPNPGNSRFRGVSPSVQLPESIHFRN